MNLQQIFADLKGVSFVGLTTTTIPKLKGGKSNPMQGRVTKRSKVAGYVYTNSNTNSYVNAVKKEVPAFEVKERKWGERLENTCVVLHKGMEYLELIVQSGKSEYFLDGKPITKDSIEGLQAPRKNTEHSVIIRDYKAESIDEIRYNGNEYYGE